MLFLAPSGVATARCIRALTAHGTISREPAQIRAAEVEELSRQIRSGAEEAGDSEAAMAAAAAAVAATSWAQVGCAESATRRVAGANFIGALEWWPLVLPEVLAARQPRKSVCDALYRGVASMSMHGRSPEESY